MKIIHDRGLSAIDKAHNKLTTKQKHPLKT